MAGLKRIGGTRLGGGEDDGGVDGGVGTSSGRFNFSLLVGVFLGYRIFDNLNFIIT